ncbi:MAG: hypothetical protein R6X10_01205 [Desulfobacterales bacterium]
MEIFHTSDWHLGRSLYGRKRYEEFAAFLDWLVQTIEDEKIDALTRMNLKPAEARDLLLPKLMDGEVVVEPGSVRLLGAGKREDSGGPFGWSGRYEQAGQGRGDLPCLN